MIGLFRWFLVGEGLVYLFSQAAIMAAFRQLLRKSPLLTTLVYCPACLGFWVGAAIYPLWPWAFEQPFAQSMLESGTALMCVGAMWGAIWGNPAYQHEVLGDGQEAAEASAQDDGGTSSGGGGIDEGA